jgi:hypothetical protein
MDGYVLGPGPNGGYQWYPVPQGARSGVPTGAVPTVQTAPVPMTSAASDVRLADVSRTPLPNLLMPPVPGMPPDRPAGTLPRHIVAALAGAGAPSPYRAMPGGFGGDARANWPQYPQPAAAGMAPPSWWEQLLGALGIGPATDIGAYLPTADGGMKRMAAQGGRKDGR